MKLYTSQKGFAAIQLLVASGVLLITASLWLASSTIIFKKDINRRLDSETLHRFNRSALEMAAQLTQRQILIPDGAGSMKLRPPTGEPIAVLYRWFLGREPSDAELGPKLDKLVAGIESHIDIGQEIRAQALQELGPVQGGDAAINIRALYRTLLGRYPTVPELQSALLTLGTEPNPEGLPEFATQLAGTYGINPSDLKALHTELAQEYLNEFFFAVIPTDKTRAEWVTETVYKIAAGYVAIAETRAILLDLPISRPDGWDWEALGIATQYYLLSAGACGHNTAAMARAILGPLAGPSTIVGSDGLLIADEQVQDSGQWYTKGPNTNVEQNGCDLVWAAQRFSESAPFGTNATFTAATPTSAAKIKFENCASNDPDNVADCLTRYRVQTEISLGNPSAVSELSYVSSTAHSRFSAHQNISAARDTANIAYPAAGPAPTITLEVRSSNIEAFGVNPVTVDPNNITAELRWSAPPTLKNCEVSPLGHSVAQNGTQTLGVPGWNPAETTSYVVFCRTPSGDVLTSNSVRVVLQQATCTPADTITFEDINGVPPVSFMQIRDQFVASHGVRFCRGVENNGKPFECNPIDLMTTGPDAIYLLCDTLHPAHFIFPGEHPCPLGNTPGYFRNDQQSFGKAFLWDPPGTPPLPPLVPIWVEYLTPVSKASGYVIDVDESEQVEIIARNSAGIELERKTLRPTDPESGDAVGTYWSFTRPSNEIAWIEIKANDMGFGFDNFSPGKLCQNTLPPPAPTFNAAGGFNDEILALVPAPDNSGDFYVGGKFTQYKGTTHNRIVRLHQDGSVANVFNAGIGFNGTVYTIAAANDGTQDIYVGGDFVNYNGSQAQRIIRLTGSGQINGTFRTGAAWGFPTWPVSQIQPIDNSTDIYVAGQFVQYRENNTLRNAQRIIRLRNDASIENSFKSDTQGPHNTVETILQVPGSDSLYVGGWMHFYITSLPYNADPNLGPVQNVVECQGICRLGANGSRETAMFRPDNRVLYNNPTWGAPAQPGYPNYVGGINSITQVPGSTDLYLGGEFNQYRMGATWQDSTAHYRIIRVTETGTPVPTFNTGDGFDGGSATSVRRIAVVPDTTGDIFVVGEFTSYKGASANRIIRLHSDGSVQNAFNLGTGFNQQVNTLMFLPGDPNHVYVGGNFTTYKGNAANRIIRLDMIGGAN